MRKESEISMQIVWCAGEDQVLAMAARSLSAGYGGKELVRKHGGAGYGGKQLRRTDFKGGNTQGAA